MFYLLALTTNHTGVARNAANSFCLPEDMLYIKVGMHTRTMFNGIDKVGHPNNGDISISRLEQPR
jgi:hypothetical protein